MDTLYVKCWKLRFPSPIMKLVALAIARKSHERGYCWASQAVIAEDTGLAVRTVGRAIAGLQELGWLAKTENRRDDGLRRTDSIWLTLPEVTLEAETYEPDSLSAGQLRAPDSLSTHAPHRPDSLSTHAPHRPDSLSTRTPTEPDTESADLPDSLSALPDSLSGSMRSQSPVGAVTESEQEDESLEDEKEGEESRESRAQTRAYPRGQARDARHAREARGLSGKEEIQASEGIDLKAAVETIWQEVGENGRKRSTREKVRRSLSAALSRRPRGVTATAHLERIIAGVRAYLADPETRKEGGRFERGAHRTLTGDLWETYLEAAGEEEEEMLADPRVGTALNPMPLLQRLWAERARAGEPWEPHRGPPPGMPGCRIAPEIQRAFGFTPYEPPAPPAPPAPPPSSLDDEDLDDEDLARLLR